MDTRRNSRLARKAGVVIMPEPITQSFEEFCAIHRQTVEPDHSHLRGQAGMSGRQVKYHDKRYIGEVEAKYDERMSLRLAYAAAIESGAIRPPTKMERLRKLASGHPDNPATQAAQRLLKKNGWA